MHPQVGVNWQLAVPDARGGTPRAREGPHPTRVSSKVWAPLLPPLTLPGPSVLGGSGQADRSPFLLRQPDCLCEGQQYPSPLSGPSADYRAAFPEGPACSFTRLRCKGAQGENVHPCLCVCLPVPQLRRDSTLPLSPTPFGKNPSQPPSRCPLAWPRKQCWEARTTCRGGSPTASGTPSAALLTAPCSPRVPARKLLTPKRLCSSARTSP